MRSALVIRNLRSSAHIKQNYVLRFHSNRILNEKKPPAEEILQIIQCPLSKGNLFYDSKKHEVVSLTARIAYPVYEDGVINLCPHDARVMAQEELQAFANEARSGSQN